MAPLFPSTSAVSALRKRQRRGVAISLTPLIDVIFVVLIFFMLVGRLTTPDALAITPPNSSSERAPEAQPILVLLGADGRLAFEGEVMSDDVLEGRIAQRMAGREELSVRLKADGRSDANRVIAVLRLLENAGVERLVLLTLPAEH
ncbi:ExbD/TolR family protein [Algihabitans albus]|uniref:ExbD/TolR family protein n=1 Tax=Algihabitans albus TaxID=2164067 RepID=UPI000E5C710B|nr:biopolymer transporter ExbD [Algihabitans albus]